MRALLLALLAASAASAAPGGGPQSSQARLGSLSGLLKVSGAMARQWSPGAVLYSILGSAPGNPKRWQPERWEFFYGDPKTKDGAFHAVFEDGTLRGRSGIKGGVQVVEQFTDGRLMSHQAGLSDWTTNDYADCRPVAVPFLDTARLDERVRAAAVVPDEEGAFRLVLLRPRNDDCDGLGYLSEYLPEKPIPRRMRGKTLWIVSGAGEAVFFDGVSGRALLRRLKRGPTGPKAAPAGPNGP